MDDDSVLRSQLSAARRRGTMWGLLAFATIMVGILSGMFGLPWYVLLLFVVPLAACIWLAAKAGNEASRLRTRMWEQACARRGWAYTKQDRADRPNRFPRFAPFGVGHSRRAYDIVSGKLADGTPFELFTYEWKVTRRSGKHEHTETHRAAVATTTMPLAAPDLAVSPETIGHKLFDALGGEDIDTESEEFSKAFWVRCGDRRFAYDVLHTAAMEWLLRNGRDGSWQWRDATLLWHRTGTLKLDQLDALAARLAGFRGLVPRHLLAAAATAERA